MPLFHHCTRWQDLAYEDFGAYRHLLFRPPHPLNGLLGQSITRGLSLAVFVLEFSSYHFKR